MPTLNSDDLVAFLRAVFDLRNRVPSDLSDVAVDYVQGKGVRLCCTVDASALDKIGPEADAARTAVLKAAGLHVDD